MLRIGIFGGGVVGGGVCELLQRHAARFRTLGVHIEVAKICVRDISKYHAFSYSFPFLSFFFFPIYTFILCRPRDFVLPKETSLVTNYDDILNDSSINCVVELIGGVTSAKDVVFRAIKAGKHVITANKALLATHLTELINLLKDHPEVKFSYEAAVCGGIPIIHALQTDYLADDITKVMGIMNGTTNYMLSKMQDEGADYGPILKEAQALGYAEANPEADVEGFDVQAKIALLAKLCFGRSIDPATIPTSVELCILLTFLFILTFLISLPVPIIPQYIPPFLMIF